MRYDVVVAGGGPVGLFLACDLRSRGLSVLVLERDTEPGSPLKRVPFGVRGLRTPGIEVLDRHDLLTPLLPQSRDDQLRWSGGHFAGIPLDAQDIDPSHWTYQLPGVGTTQLDVTLEDLERVLAERAILLGVDVRRGAAVSHIESAADEVTVRAGDERYRGRWLVGCDGDRSAVREKAGFSSLDAEPEFTGYSLSVDIADPAVLPPARERRFFPLTEGPGGLYTQWQPGALAMIDFDGGAFHGSGPITRGHVQRVLRRITGTDVTVNAMRFASTWTDRARQATTYRRGRVLLAGDAAHTHSPVGGEGLGLGLADAANLGWKLAATVRGRAPDGLLDTYSAERHPVAERVFDWTRAQVALLRPGAHALKAVFRDLVRTRAVATHLAERLWGVSRACDLGGSHPLVGRSCPDFEFGRRTRVGTLLQSGAGLLLDFSRESALRALANRWGDQVTYLAARPEDRLGLGAVLVRPDGVVAWAGDTAADPEEVSQAAARWFAPQVGAANVAAAGASPEKRRTP
ncbi:FAD-dependent monooxygenase [Amycolatopsis sp. NPDC051061]|uniref:FAD-dependent monooxygenase n=1 Tax=Amycolatopsis sp. NPDC051061 TaxID=3155042 RepID=UPI00343410B5